MEDKYPFGHKDEDQEDPSQEEEYEGLTLEQLAELMRTAKELQEKAKSRDLYMVRSLQFSNAIDSSMSAYILTKVKKNNQATSKENTTPPPEVSEEEELPELL